MIQVPPPPPGFQIIEGPQGVPPPPPGFTMAPQQAAPRRAPAQRGAPTPNQTALVPDATPALNELGITDQEEREALLAQGYSPEEVTAFMTNPDAMSVAQSASTTGPDPLNIRVPEAVNLDALNAMNPGGPRFPEAAPFVLRSGLSPEEETAQREQAMTIRKGDFVQFPDGRIEQAAADAYVDPRLQGEENQVAGGIYNRNTGLEDRARAFITGAAEQVPFLDEAAIAATAAAEGKSFSEIADRYRMAQYLDNQARRGERNAGGVAGFAGTLAAPGVGASGRFIQAGQTGANQVARAGLVGALGGGTVAAGAEQGGLEERLQAGGQGAILGATTGAVLQGGLNRLGRASRETPQRRLSRQGQELTLGQMLGGGAQRVEDALTSIPFAGDAVRNRQRDALTSFDTVATNTALSPLGQALESSAGRQGVRDADEIIGAAYRRALEPVQRFDPADATLQAELAAARSPERLTGDSAAALSSTLDNIFSQAPDVIDGQTWKRIDSQLAAATRAADAGSATRPEMTALRDRLSQARTAWRDALGRTDAGALEAVNAADAAEAQYRLVRKASADVASAGRGGDASPATLNRAVVGNANDRRAARGESLLQDLTDDAMQVLPRTVPDSGTPFRSLITNAGVGGGLSVAGVDPLYLGLAAALQGGVSAAYSKQAQRLANRLYRGSDTGGSTRDVSQLAEILARQPLVSGLVLPDAQRPTPTAQRAQR